jgi:hypothetical protein
MRNTNRFLSVSISLILLVFAFGITACRQSMPVEQVSIARIDSMPALPEPYKMLNWLETSVEFDEYVFNHTLTGDYMPFIWLDDNQRNFSQTTFGLYTAIGDVRQGADKNNGEFHEAINSLGALLSAGLVGIDKTQQDGFNYVKMVQNYFNSENGWNIMMNNTTPEIAHLGGGYGRDWWYDMFPNVLYYAVSDVFPGIERSDSLLRIIAEQVLKADSVLDGNYHFSYFDYAAMQGMHSHIPFQEDAAAAHAWILLAAWEKFGDERYLEGSHSAMQALLSQNESRFYEVLMPFGAYTAARLNAEHNGSYDITTILEWTFEGTHAADGRYGWGVILDRWGEYDVSGLVGSWSHDGGFAFLMNTFDLAWPLVPMLRYAPEYSVAVGKWMLNAANASRFFYPHEMPDEHQWLPQQKAITRNVIAYEGLKKTDHLGNPDLIDVSPVALGDGPLWVEGQPVESVFSLYGSAHAGIFGAIIQETNVERILRLNCLATDFYRQDAFPTWLIYNPYGEDKTIDYQYLGNPVNLYDVLSGEFIVLEVTSSVPVLIPKNHACLIVEVPVQEKLRTQDQRVYAGKTVIKY